MKKHFDKKLPNSKITKPRDRTPTKRCRLFSNGYGSCTSKKCKFLHVDVYGEMKWVAVKTCGPITSFSFLPVPFFPAPSATITDEENDNWKFFYGLDMPIALVIYRTNRKNVQGGDKSNKEEKFDMYFDSLFQDQQLLWVWWIYHVNMMRWIIFLSDLIFDSF